MIKVSSIKYQVLSIDNRGFTLIELIVVMAIIAILAVAVGGTYSSSQAKGRDGRRKGDLANLSRSLEFYYNDRGRYPPASSGQISSCGTSCNSACSWGGGPMCNPSSTSTTYIQTLPKDPSSNRQYYYRTDTNGTRYALYAKLENIKDPQCLVTNCSGSGSVTTDCETGSGNQACNYGISSPNTTPLETW